MPEDHDAELDAIVAEAVAAGLLVEAVEDGQPTLQLTPLGAQVARRLAMRGNEEPDAVLDAAEKRPT